ncbi:MAG TPA: nicotinate (nicotinamide) nucleotide adenylyltransferase [Pseudorhodoplanes sp.]|jgi:nicotinate-nucleotide adenylyltransferase|nr:nicotinate (nicotinamide) nucleotide adenylyltransferase [Pseudorhodoplanes sp.]
MLRTLIFGGTFNPVHIGHLRAAIEVMETLGYDRLEWVPSYSPLHKSDQSLLGFELRVAMLRAALRDDCRSTVSEIERDLPVPSVTFQTLEAMQRSDPDVDRYFLLGDREFLRLHKWRFGAGVVGLTHIVVACRTEFDLDTFVLAVAEAWPESRRIEPQPGALMAFELRPGRRALVVPLPRIDASSSLVRRRWLEGRSLAHLVPDAVIELMEAHRGEVEAAWRAPRACVLPSP